MWNLSPIRSTLRGALGCALLATSCAHFGPPADDGHGTGGEGGGTQLTGCAQAALIEDVEDRDDRILVRDGRGGYLYTYIDEDGSTISPGPDSFAVAPGGAGGGHALHMQGKLADTADAFAGLGYSFTEPLGPYDASKYTGVAFVAKHGPGSSTAIRLKIPDIATAPEGGVCKECYNDFGIDFQVTDEWTRYEVSFADLKQGTGWGDPRPDAVDAAKLFGMQWQVTTRGQAYDIWIDDVTFVGCPD